MKLAVSILLILVAVGIFIYFSPNQKTILETDNKTEHPKIPASVDLTDHPVIPPENEKKQIARPPGLPAVTNSSHEEIEQRLEALAEASAKDDSESLNLILTALKDPQPEIRKAALDAAIQFGSRDAIPALKEIAANTGDAREKVEILDAIEFLELPSLSEIKRPRRTNSNPAAVNGAPK